MCYLFLALWQRSKVRELIILVLFCVVYIPMTWGIIWIIERTPAMRWSWYAWLGVLVVVNIFDLVTTWVYVSDGGRDWSQEWNYAVQIFGPSLGHMTVLVFAKIITIITIVALLVLCDYEEKARKEVFMFLSVLLVLVSLNNAIKIL